MQSTQQPKAFEPKQDLLVLLNVLMGSYFLDEAIYELRHTTYYKQDVKAKANSMAKAVTPIIERDLALLHGADDEAMAMLIENLRDTMGEIATLRLEHIAAYGEVLRRFKADPDSVLDLLGIQIVESVQIEEVAA
jgi:hypothetical protein